MRQAASGIALVFPGQGSQAVGMGKDFFANFRESSVVFEEASDAIHLDLKKLCFEGPADELTLTENLQPALFTVEMAMLAAVRAHSGLSPLVCAGHSLGEYSALAATGSLSLADGVRLTRSRGEAMQRAVPVGRGTMAAILGLDGATVEKLCASVSKAPDMVVEPANFNAPGQVVIAGTVDGVAAACQLLKDDPELKRGKARPLQVSAPFHCSLMKPAQQAMAPRLAATRFAPPRCPVIPNSTASPSILEQEFAGYLTDQIVQPVRWEQSMNRLRDLGVKQVVELGPGKVLTGLQKRIDSEIAAAGIATVDEMRGVFK